jgi:hypothetical protein
VVGAAALDLLTRDFVAHGMDMKHLTRTICRTRAYQIAAAPAGGPASAGKLTGERVWARYRLRPLGPEELIAALDVATRFDSALERFARGNLEQQRLAIRRGVGFLFDVDEEMSAEDAEGTLPQALMLLNGELSNQTTRAAPGLALTDVLSLPVGDEQKIEALFLRTLSRRPTAEETRRFAGFVRAPRQVVASAGKTLPRAPRPPAETGEAQAYQDLFLALLNSSEFYYRH